jgi:hypothetical protein
MNRARRYGLILKKKFFLFLLILELFKEMKNGKKESVGGKKRTCLVENVNSESDIGIRF